MKNTKTAQLTLGAVLLAVFLVLHLIIPGGQKSLQGMLLIITFLPAALYCMRFGAVKTLIVVAAGVLLSGLLLPLEVFLSFAVPALLIGFVAGLTYGKIRRLSVILILSIMYLLQNLGEMLVYYLLSNINPVDTYVTMVGLVYDAIPAEFLNHQVFSQFLEDFLLCAVPCLAVMVAGAKGILSFMILKLLDERLESFLGNHADPEMTKVTQFKGKAISIAYFCAICICATVSLLPFLSVVKYHFVSAAFAAAGFMLALLYAYYFYINRIRTQQDQQRKLIFSFLMMVTLPIGIFAWPLLEIRLLKEQTQSK